MKPCQMTQSDRNALWLIAGSVIGIALVKKANENLLAWYDRGLETLQIIAAMIG
ncbi:MAG: hypothetical protein AAGH53_12215 [Pseudomonadota bacterium]